MSTELIAICGVGVTMIGVAVTLAGLILNGHRDLRTEMQAQRERMAHLEGLLEGLREAITGRRVAVAEAAGQYEPR